MEMFIRKRGEGKTFALLKKAATADYQMVCCSEREVRAVLKMAEGEGLTIRRPITYDDLYEGVKLQGTHCKGLIIDDIDTLVIYMLQRVVHGNNIIAASATGDPELFKPLDVFNQLR